MPLTHAQRLALARESPEGLSIGDAVGEALSYRCSEARSRADFTHFRPGSVAYTADASNAPPKCAT